MANHQVYVPILKWKMGEYQALHRLESKIKDRVLPLIELPPVGYDFEARRDRESLDDHLGDFGARLKAKWQTRRCLVDLKYLPNEARMADGTHFVQYVFGACREEGCHAAPVVTVGSDARFRSAVARVAASDRRGICIRLSLEDFDRENLNGEIESLLRACSTSWAEADLVIDTGAPNYVPQNAFVRMLRDMIREVPSLNRWRSVTVAGTSYPQSIAALERPFAIAPRQEWSAYQALLHRLGTEVRIPSFGDYGVAHPDLVELDMRLIKPFAKLRYTTGDSWHIARGSPVRTHGFEQYREMCGQLGEQAYFDGEDYSAADRYIADCSEGDVPTGNLSTWVWVSTNRHITKVVNDLATLHGL